MTKRQAALFFFGATGLFALVFVVLTIDSHQRFPALTNAEGITPLVLEGKDVWHQKNCVNCHTLLGEGAYYAPDLTQIAAHRGDAYLTQFMRDPARFYSETDDGRLMTDPQLEDAEVEAVIAFLGWINGIENQNWPPRPILVSGSALPGVFDRGFDAPEAASDDPVALGEALFYRTPPGCFACHSTSPGVTLAGPALAGVAGRAEALIASGEYGGGATSPEAYIREAIVQPSAHLVPGETFSANGRSFMPDTYEESLTAEQIDQLVDYLLTLR